jgi:glycogen(starch) synthase
MEENVENPSDYGIYIVDRRMKSVEESIQQLSDIMVGFCQKSRRQRINQRNRTERLSDILDWKRMGLEYVRARQLALRRRYRHAFLDAEEGEEAVLGTVAEPLLSLEKAKVKKPLSVSSSPKSRASLEEDEEEQEKEQEEGEEEGVYSSGGEGLVVEGCGTPKKRTANGLEQEGALMAQEALRALESLQMG